MKQKTITVNYRVRTTNEDIIESMIEEYEDNVEDIIALFAEAEDEGRIAVSYQYGDREVNAYFYDNEIWEGITQYSLEQIQQGMIYIPHPYIKGMERNGNIVRVEMILDMPWDKAEIPALPDTEQTYTAVQGEPVPLIYECKIVGVKHHASEKLYEELENKVMRRETAILKKEPDNQYDINAIAAFTSEGDKIGYIPKEDTSILNVMIGDKESVEAELSYMDFRASTIRIRIRTSVTSSVSAEKLFNAYTPIEVYRANYVFRKWGGIAEKGEAGLFDKEKQLIDFDKFNSLPIDLQDRIADSWLVRMTKATVENPTNPGFRMRVPLDLSVYGTSWKELDLSNELFLNFIEAENKMLAVYIRTRRMTRNLSPEEFVAEMNLEDMGETIMKRMHYIHDNNML